MRNLKICFWVLVFTVFTTYAGITQFQPWKHIKAKVLLVLLKNPRLGVPAKVSTPFQERLWNCLAWLAPLTHPSCDVLAAHGDRRLRPSSARAAQEEVTAEAWWNLQGAAKGSRSEVRVKRGCLSAHVSVRGASVDIIFMRRGWERIMWCLCARAQVFELFTQPWAPRGTNFSWKSLSPLPPLLLSRSPSPQWGPGEDERCLWEKSSDGRPC